MHSTILYVPCAKIKKLEKNLGLIRGVVLKIGSVDSVDSRLGTKIIVESPSEDDTIMAIHQAWHVMNSELPRSSCEVVWHYIDPHEKRQGPYTATKLIGWLKKGFFSKSLNDDGVFLVEHKDTRAWLPLELLSIIFTDKDKDGDWVMDDAVHLLRLDAVFQEAMNMAVDMDVEVPSFFLPADQADEVMFDPGEADGKDLLPDPISLNQGLDLLTSAQGRVHLFIVLDTNVLMLKSALRVLNQLCLHFSRHQTNDRLKVTAFIPWQVICELDGLKSRADGKGDVATQARQAIDQLRVHLDKKDGFIRGETLNEYRAASKLLQGGGTVSGDDRILSSCLHLNDELSKGKEEPGGVSVKKLVALLSNDNNLRAKAIINHIHACSTASSQMPITSSWQIMIPFLLSLLGLSEDQIKSLRGTPQPPSLQPLSLRGTPQPPSLQPLSLQPPSGAAISNRPPSEMDVDELREEANDEKPHPHPHPNPHPQPQPQPHPGLNSVTVTPSKPISSFNATPPSASKPFSILAWADDEDEDDEMEAVSAKEAAPSTHTTPSKPPLPPPAPLPPTRFTPPPPPKPRSQGGSAATTPTPSKSPLAQHWWHTKDPAQLLSTASPTRHNNAPPPPPIPPPSSTLSEELDALTLQLGPSCEWILRQSLGASFESRVARKAPWKGPDIVLVLRDHFDLFRDHLGANSAQVKRAIEALDQETRGGQRKLNLPPSAEALRALEALREVVQRAKQGNPSSGRPQVPQPRASSQPQPQQHQNEHHRGKHWGHDDRC